MIKLFIRKVLNTLITKVITTSSSTIVLAIAIASTIVLVNCFSLLCFSAFPLPSLMDAATQKLTLTTLGFGSAPKLLSNPFPLGGYSGIEYALDIKSLNMEILSSKMSSKEPLRIYPLFSIGKGIYYNTDLFINFTPFDTDLSEFGALIRWNFYQGTYRPYYISIIAHANTVNFSNRLIVQNDGLDLLLGVYLKPFSFFITTGSANSTGQFSGGNPDTSTTLSGQTESKYVNSWHSCFGAIAYINYYFVVVQIDYYQDSIISSSIGMRF